MIQRVVCAISGGVDSAVSAAILKKKGFEVIGVYMNNWDFVEEGENHCPRTLDETDAQRICTALDIKYYRVDFVKEYWNGVFERFLDGYRAGKTLVADVECNALIKFEALHRFSIDSLGVDAVATGHYAQNSLGNFLENTKKGAIPHLLTAVDPLKDQTYFLSRISENQLRRSMFPIGDQIKSNVKKMAVEMGLNEVAEKKESMGLCYVGKRRKFSEFLEKYIPDKKGNLVDIETAEVIGEHNGIHHFTIGKRVAINTNYPTHYGFYVCKIDSCSNIVYLRVTIERVFEIPPLWHRPIVVSA
uniref:tRNA-5-taurinomethyluridine 2-sulfurtransferase n=1 Tax=Bursaphelenchus xylophilus TaxID=6326 RepID=A0A1I7S768_BURXY